MGWETRRNGRYYYKKRKVGGKVQSVYMGGGDVGEASAMLDELTRARQQAEREEWQRQMEADAALDAEIAEYGLVVRRTVAAVLLASGYHRPKRQWRLRRAGDEQG